MCPYAIRRALIVESYCIPEQKKCEITLLGVKQIVSLFFPHVYVQTKADLGLAHINNLYNTAFWALVKDGMTTTEANKALQVCLLHPGRKGNPY